MKPKISKKKPIVRVDHKKEFIKAFEKLAISHNRWIVWSDFVIMFACSLSNSLDKKHYDEREKMYLRRIRHYQKNEQELFPKLAAEVILSLDDNPKQDFLGELFMSMKFGNDSKGQIFTPYHICEMMAKIVLENAIEEIERKGFITIQDPCCGAGATLIASANEIRELLEKKKLNFQNHVLIAAQDIDITVALMCYIQLSLLGVAGYVKVGNSLTDPITEKDSLENYWFTPMYFSPVWQARKVFQSTKKKMP